MLSIRIIALCYVKLVSNQDTILYHIGTTFGSSITLVYVTVYGYHMLSMATYYSVIWSTLLYAYGYKMHYFITGG